MLAETHYEFQRRVKREPRKEYNESEAIFMMTGIDPREKVEKKKKKRFKKKDGTKGRRKSPVKKRTPKAGVTKT